MLIRLHSITLLQIYNSTLQQVGGAEETEVVSEDELPEVQKPSVKDAENVSDDELPGPKPAELPADTEVWKTLLQNYSFIWF